MINLVWRTDIHFSDKAPQSRTDDWKGALLDKMSQIGEIAREVNAEAVLDGGDLFHIKSPNRTSHSLVQSIMEVQSHYPCPTYACIGNHDVVYGDYTYINQQPLGVLFSSGVLNRLYDEHEAVFSKNGVTVRVVGIPYHGVRYDWDRFASIKKGDEDYLVVVAHVLASEKGGSMFEGEDIIKYADLKSLDPDVWCFQPDTEITLFDGTTVIIQDLKPTDVLLGRGGERVTIEEIHPVRDVDEDVYHFECENIHKDWMKGVTSDHPFWVAQDMNCHLPSRKNRRCTPAKEKKSYPCNTCEKPADFDPTWTAAKDIQKGDYVAIPFPKVGERNEPKKAKLLGLYLAEGHLILNRKKEPYAGVGFTFHSDETDLHKETADLLKEVFGLEAHYSYSKQSKCVQIMAYGREVSEFFLHNGGRYSDQKKLSDWVWSLDSESRLNLLLGWLSGDGHVRSNTNKDRIRSAVMGATISKCLADQLFLLSLSLGLKGSYTVRPEKRDFSLHKECHILSFHSHCADRLSKHLGQTLPVRSKSKVMSFFEDGMYWVRVKKVVVKPYVGPVYNMRTSSNEYVAGKILTHNCFGHWHKDQGVTEIASGKYVVNVGSLSRGSLSQDNLDRIPKCCVLKFSQWGIDIESRELKVQPAEEIFDIEGKERQEVRTEVIDSFVESLSGSLTSNNAQSLSETVSHLEVSSEVKERVLAYIEQAQGV